MAETSGNIAVSRRTRARHALAFFLLAAVWLFADQATKRFFETTQQLGAVVPGSDFGILQFRLVHNTGAAWSLLSDMTWLLGTVSLVVCAGMFIYAILWVKKPNWILTCGAALVFAGGLGNAIDRLAQGYVVDFIEATFVDFPVFNVADIGVTCGFILALIGAYRYLEWRDRQLKSCEGVASNRKEARDSAVGKKGERR